MRKRQNAKSLGAVHTHTHTPILIQWRNLAIQKHYVNRADLLDSLEREQESTTEQICWTVWRESKRVEKTCSVCDAQKLEEIEKGFNIKLGYFEMEKFISNIAELFVLQRSD